MKLKLYNIDRENAIIGGVAEPHDRAIVYDEDLSVKHPLTGELQPKPIFNGTLEEAQKFIKTQTRMKLASDIFDKSHPRIGDLFERWSDESEYEDFADYEKVMKTIIEENGGTFIKGTKRPFGCHFSVDNVPYRIFVNSRQIGYDRIKQNKRGKS